MLLKYTLNHIFAKPLRLVILLFCMTIACLAGYLAIDFDGLLKTMMYVGITTDYGETDYLMTCFTSEGVTDDLFDGGPSVRYTGRVGLYKREITRTNKYYNFALTESIMLYAYTDYENARGMRLVPLPEEPSDGEVAISKKYSEKYGYQVGDTLTVIDYNDNPVDLTVCEIYEESYNLGKMSGLISFGEYELLKGTSVCKAALVDVVDNADRESFKQFMNDEHPNVSLVNIFLSEDVEQELRNYASMVYLIFVLVFVLVIFVTISFTEKIITERMSAIGTLRSIGMSRRKTTAILLFENVLYGLTGSILALLIYLLVRGILLRAVLNDVPLDTETSVFPFAKCLLVILGAVLIQVVIPLSEVMKAVRTSIRDIIFDNRDSEFHVSVKKTIAGVVLITAGLFAGFLGGTLWITIPSVLLVIMGGSLVVQFIVAQCTKLLSGVFANARMPVAEFAAKETGSKKPNSSNAVLAVAALTAAAAIFVCGYSIITSMNSIDYRTNLIVTNTGLTTDKYRYLEETSGVTDVTYLYQHSDSVSFNGFKRESSVWSLPDSTRCTALGSLPGNLADDEIIVDQLSAFRAKISVGDTIEAVFRDRGIFPITKQVRVVGFTEKTPFMNSSVTVISPKLFKELYTDTVSTILIGASDPKAVEMDVDASMTKGETVQTLTEYTKEVRKKSRTITLILIAVMLAAVALTLIGISGNQVIGFVSRKKEYAMLHACACSRKDIIKTIWIENALLFGISTILSGVLCVPVSYMISKIFMLADLGISVVIRYGVLFGCLVVLWIITMMTCLSPIRSLKNMNTAMEIKYE